MCGLFRRRRRDSDTPPPVPPKPRQKSESTVYSSTTITPKFISYSSFSPRFGSKPDSPTSTTWGRHDSAQEPSTLPTLTVTACKGGSFYRPEFFLSVTNPHTDEVEYNVSRKPGPEDLQFHRGSDMHPVVMGPTIATATPGAAAFSISRPHNLGSHGHGGGSGLAWALSYLDELTGDIATSNAVELHASWCSLRRKRTEQFSVEIGGQMFTWRTTMQNLAEYPHGNYELVDANEVPWAIWGNTQERTNGLYGRLAILQPRLSKKMTDAVVVSAICLAERWKVIFETDTQKRLSTMYQN